MYPSDGRQSFPRLNHEKAVIREDRAKLGPLDDLLVIKLRLVDIQLSSAFYRIESDHRVGVIPSLALIVGNPGMSQNDLSRLSGMDKSTIFAIVNELEEFGWARRSRSKRDARRHELYATPAGQAKLLSVAASMKAFEAKLLRDIDDGELHHLMDLLERMDRSCRRVLLEMDLSASHQDDDVAVSAKEAAVR